MSEPVVDKIRKLLAVAAEGSGATDGERDAALEAASRLMAKYRIEQHHLDAAAGAQARRDTGVVAIDIDTYEQRDWWRIDLAQAIGLTVTVDAVFVQDRTMGGTPIRHLTLIGKRVSAEWTKLVWEWVVPQLLGQAAVMAQAEVSYREVMHGRTPTPEDIDAYLEGFYRAAIQAILERLQARQRADLGTYGTAIEVSDRHALDDYYGDDAPVPVDDDRRVDQDAVAAGWRAGYQADIDPSNKLRDDGPAGLPAG